MSRVTFGDLYSDYINVETPVEDCKKVKSVEIVPRKIVEMIIGRCSIGEKLVNKTTAMEVRDIRNYAESLLKQFEEEEEQK